MKPNAIVETKMQECLDRLGLPIKVVLLPDGDKTVHGELKSNCILIYDKSESEAWLTFEHEVYEYKLKEVTFPYRTLVNSLIEVVEKLTYERKEKFLEFLPEVTRVIVEEKR